MNTDFWKYGFYINGYRRALTLRQVRNPKVVRWIRNELAALDMPYTQMEDFFVNYLRDTRHIFIRRRRRDGQWVEAVFPTCRAFSNDVHFWEDASKPVPMDKLPRRPRPEVVLRYWIIGSILRAMKADK